MPHLPEFHMPHMPHFHLPGHHHHATELAVSPKVSARVEGSGREGGRAGLAVCAGVCGPRSSCNPRSPRSPRSTRSGYSRPILTSTTSQAAENGAEDGGAAPAINPVLTTTTSQAVENGAEDGGAARAASLVGAATGEPAGQSFGVKLPPLAANAAAPSSTANPAAGAAAPSRARDKTPITPNAASSTPGAGGLLDRAGRPSSPRSLRPASPRSLPGSPRAWGGTPADFAAPSSTADPAGSAAAAPSSTADPAGSAAASTGAW